MSNNLYFVNDAARVRWLYKMAYAYARCNLAYSFYATNPGVLRMEQFYWGQMDDIRAAVDALRVYHLFWNKYLPLARAALLEQDLCVRGSK